MLAPSLGRHGRDGSFNEFEQRLLHALSGDIPGDGGVVGLARDLVDLVDIHDSALGLVDVVVTFLKELLDDVLDILSDIARFGKCRRISDGKGYVQQARQRLRKQRLATPGRPYQENIAFAQLDVIADLAPAHIEPFVVIVNRYRKDFLCARLPDHILVEYVLDRAGSWQSIDRTAGRVILNLFGNDVIAQVDALVANEHRRAGNQFAYIMLALAAKRAIKRLATVAIFTFRCHQCLPVARALAVLMDVITIASEGKARWITLVWTKPRPPDRRPWLRWHS